MPHTRPSVVRISKQQMQLDDLRQSPNSNRSSTSIRNNQVQPNEYAQANKGNPFKTQNVLTITRARLLAIIASAILVVLLGIAGAAIGIILSRSTTTTTSTTTTSATATTQTTTTATTATTSTTTSKTTSTTTVTTISTTTSTTTATTATTTSTSTSTTTPTTTTTTVTTTTTSKTTTTTATTTTTVTTSTTATTTATTAFDSCTGLQWNQTGIRVAGSNSAGSNANQLKKPYCVYIDANESLYICDAENDRIQKWTVNASSGTTVTGNSNGNSGSSATELKMPRSLVFDLNGFMYVSDYENHRVQRYPPNSNVGQTVAGLTSTSGSGTNLLKHPSCILVDEDQNLFIADSENDRVVKWAENATSGIVVIANPGSGTSEIKKPYGLLLINGSSNHIYLSVEEENRVQLWMFGAQQANSTLSSGSLNKPRGILMDPYGNVYVADKDNNRIQMFCANSSAVVTIIGAGGSLNKPSGIAIDSKLNLYVANTDDDEVLKFLRL